MSFERYIDVVSGNFKKAIKVEWLNPDETVNFEFTNSLYDIGVDLSVNYQNGSRRTCTLTLNNYRNRFPINFNNIWIGQKFKLWMGVYIDEKTPYYLPQGVFYISNPNEVYQPTTKTVKINGVDKWAFLDGTLHGKLSGIYQTNIGVNLYDATRELLTLPVGSGNIHHTITTKIFSNYFDHTEGFDSIDFKYEMADGKFQFRSGNKAQGNSTSDMTLVAKCDMTLSFKYRHSANRSSTFTTKIRGDVVIESQTTSSANNYAGSYMNEVKQGDKIVFKFVNGLSASGEVVITDVEIKTIDKTAVVDPSLPILSSYYIGKTTVVPVWDEKSGKYVDTETEVLKCPYTAKVERGKTYADILLEYATILCARIYYDVNGHLVIEPMIDTADDITDTNKEVVWHYTVDERTFLGLTQSYNFDKVYNDIIVLGNIVNGKQFKARVQNRNAMSDTCIQKIGQKTREPFEDNQYYSDEQCKELAMYYAKMDTILQKSGTIESTSLYHLDVNKLLTVSTPNNNMSKELFLISGFSLSSSGTMSISVTSVNVLKDFSVVEVE